MMHLKILLQHSLFWWAQWILLLQGISLSLLEMKLRSISFLSAPLIHRVHICTDGNGASWQHIPTADSKSTAIEELAVKHCECKVKNFQLEHLLRLQ